MMKYLNKIVGRTGPAPAPSEEFGHMSNISKHEGKKKKLKATPGRNLWRLSEKLPPNESITRKQMENKRGTSENQMTCLKGQNINTTQRIDKMCHYKGCCKAKKS